MLRLEPFLDAAEQLVLADEVERALALLDNLPAVWRHEPPPEVTRLRDEILERIATPADYVKIEEGMRPYFTSDEHRMRETLRYDCIATDVGKLNEKGLVPVISDFGPAEYWLPVLLEHVGMRFCYSARHLNQRLYDQAAFSFMKSHTRIPGADSPRMFCALEIIEHMPRPQDLRVEALKCGRLPDIIHVSTPRHAYQDGETNWRNRKLLGHLRAYTLNELSSELQAVFPEYAQTVYDSTILHSRLVWRGTKIEGVRGTMGVDILGDKHG